MRRIYMLAAACLITMAGFAQGFNKDSARTALKSQKDSTLRALIHADSLKVDKEFSDKEKWNNIKSVVVYPVLKGGERSGIIPVKDPTEIPDPTLEYKLLFELTQNNPDSLITDINDGLNEIARVINLHVASGIPLKKITAVIVAHGGVLKVLTTNAYYKEHFKVDNPNLKLINDLKGIGAKFIACGQAMAFIGLKKEDMLPFVRISLTAQTVLSSYQLKGYVRY